MHRPARSVAVGGSLVRNREAHRDHPTTLGLVRLPSVKFNGATLCTADGRVEAARLIGVYLVEPVSCLASSMLSDIVCQGCRVQATSAEAKAFAEGLGRCEELVRY